MSMFGSPSRQAKPLVVIDVNLGKEKGKQKLVIYPGDCPNKASLEFGEKHCKNIGMLDGF